MSRSQIMASVHSKNTSIEIRVRKFLFSQGFRFRINVKILPGSPDIVLKKYNTVVFVNGCFWHGHDGCKNFRLPKTHIDYWESKINKNKERDTCNYLKLKELGWNVFVVWECDLLSDPKKLFSELKSVLLSNYCTQLEEK